MITVTQVGGDRLRIAIRGHELFADQPVENGGGDSAPTPTEIFIAGLAGCVAYFAEKFLRRHGLATDGLSVRCDYRWAENPHRVGEIALEVCAPGLTPETTTAFLRVIEHCTVHNTLRQAPAISLRLQPPAAAAA